MTILEIQEIAKELKHDWIILDAIKDYDNLTARVERTILDAIKKIKHIEEAYTDDEIDANNLLTDIF